MPELPARIRRIVLIGLMGSGKTTVGQIVADQLGWRVIDLDEQIEARAGMSVSQFFATRGEAAFRRLEQELTTELLSADNTVFTPGGGWITHVPVEAIPPHTAIFWLKVSPEVVVERLRDAPARPLLAGDPLERARSLAAQRNEQYAALGLPVETAGRTPSEVAAHIIAAVEPRVHG